MVNKVKLLRERLTHNGLLAEVDRRLKDLLPASGGVIPSRKIVKDPVWGLIERER